MLKRSLRVLLTNHQLGEPGGTEANVRDWAIGLLRRGHRPFAYSPVLGRTADVLREHSIPVVHDLALMTESPDIIHGSHTPTVIESIVRFPQTPALQVCQSVDYPMSEPLFLPQVRRFVAVDERTWDYLVSHGVAPGNIRLIHNAVDLRRIPARPRPLPDRPMRSLIFTKTESQIPLVREACRRAGIEVETLGRSVGRVVIDPERELVDYDLIFATARSALEAIASGAATVVMDGRGLAGMATRENVTWLRRHNFGDRSLQNEVSVESILAEIGRYDAVEATAVSNLLRLSVDIEPQLDEFESIYSEIIGECAGASVSGDQLAAALGPVMHRWLPRFPGTDWPWQFERSALLARVAELEAALARERIEVIRLGRAASAGVRKAHEARQAPISPTCRRLEPPFAQCEGVAWQLVLSFDPLLSPLRQLSDDNEHAERSPLRLLEDGEPLGPAHALHRRISEDGKGCYSHWNGNVLLFSTSDNTDPNTNGRQYSVEWAIFEE